MAGRGCLYSAERVDAILATLRDGSPRVAACTSAGISEDTFARWLKRYADFADGVKKAEAEAITRRVARIDKAGEGGALLSRRVTYNHKTDVETTEETYAQPQWTADAWLLERRYADDFGRRDKIEVNIAELVRKRAEDEGLDPAEVLAETDAILKSAR